MKKIVKLLSIMTLAVGIWSCQGEQGPVGPAGTTGEKGASGTNGTNGTNGANGKDGINGNANVKSFQYTAKVADWKDVLVTGIGNGVSSKWGSQVITNADVSTEKFVMLFLKAGDEYKALPLTYIKDDNQSLERLDYGYKTGQVNVYYRSQSQLFGGAVEYKPLSDLSLEVVLTSKTAGALLGKSGIDMKDYGKVIDFLSKNQ
jgi:hypothetical protein